MPLLWEQGVAGSNPATSTTQLKTPSIWRGFYLPQLIQALS